MLRYLLAIPLILSALCAHSQGNRATSRLFNQNAVMRYISPNNILYVDMSDPEKRIWPASMGALRFSTSQIRGLQDTINVSIARSGTSSSMIWWENIQGKPIIPVIPQNISVFNNDAGYLKQVPAQSWESITGKPNFSGAALSNNYQDLTGKPAIPAEQVNSDWNATSGKSVILNKPTIPTIPTNVSSFANDAGYLTSIPTFTWGDISGKPTLSTVSVTGSYSDLMNKPIIPSAQVPADWSAVSGVTMILNKPVIPTSLSQLTNDGGYLTSVPAQSWASITGKPPFATVSTTGSYNDLIDKPAIPGVPSNVSAFTNDAGYLKTVPAQTWASITGKPTIPSTTTDISEGANLYHTSARARASISAGAGISYDNTTGVISATSSTPTYNNAPARPVNGTSFQISTTKQAIVSYSVTHTIALTLILASGSSTVYLEISPNNSTWTNISSAGYSDGVAVAVALTKTVTNNVQGVVPAGWYVRLRSVASGGGSVSFAAGQEALN